MRLHKNKKGQAAMEFLMTYGWAILAVIVVISILAIYFRPGTLVPTTAIINTPFYGVATTLSTTQVQLEIRNNGGEALTLMDPTTPITAPTITFTPPSSSCGSGIYTLTSTDLEAGDTDIITFGSCTGLSSGDTINANVVITYRRPGSSLDQTSTGTITGRVP